MLKPKLLCFGIAKLLEPRAVVHRPSAGIALYLAMLSALTGRAVRSDRAFTGEITLRGDVLAVGGIRPRILAAERAGLQSVVLPEDKRADLPEEMQITAHQIPHVDQFHALAFTDTYPPAQPPE